MHRRGNIILWIAIAVSAVAAIAGGGYLATQTSDEEREESQLENREETDMTPLSGTKGEGTDIGTEATEVDLDTPQQTGIAEPTAPSPTPSPAPPPEPESTEETASPPPAAEEDPEPTPAPEQQIVAFTIEANDNGADPESITVPKDAIVELTFAVAETGVYFDGLRFESEDRTIETGDIAPGESETVTFLAEKSHTFIPYWPSSNTRKPYEVKMVIEE